MKPYEQLTQRGKLRRLRPLCWQVLQAYDLQVKQLSFLTIETNTMFKVVTEAGDKYVLRIYSDVDTTRFDNEVELFWLVALCQETNLNVVEPVPRRDGRYITVASVAGVPGEKRCALFKWIPGRELEHYLSTNNYFKLGCFMAQLHDHASQLDPLPAHLKPKQWDKVFYYPGETAVYHEPEHSQLFPAGRLTLIDMVIERVETFLTELYTNLTDRILIHGDLHFWNVHYYRGELYVLDFEDVLLGYPLQDIAVTLSYGRQLEMYPALKVAFQEGYQSHRSWPVSQQKQIETLIAARSVNFINYVAQYRETTGVEPEEFISYRCGQLQTFLETYG